MLSGRLDSVLRSYGYNNNSNLCSFFFFIYLLNYVCVDCCIICVLHATHVARNIHWNANVCEHMRVWSGTIDVYLLRVWYIARRIVNNKQIITTVRMMKIANNINFRKIFVRLAVHETLFCFFFAVQLIVRHWVSPYSNEKWRHSWRRRGKWAHLKDDYSYRSSSFRMDFGGWTIFHAFY